VQLVCVTSGEHRDLFAETMRRSDAVWISNESPGRFSALREDSAPRAIAWTVSHDARRDAGGLDRPSQAVDRLVRFGTTIAEGAIGRLLVMGK